jgi:hypothetical protein
MNLFKIIILSSMVIGSIFVLITLFSITQENTSIENIEFGCTPEFWKNNLKLWKVLDVDYNSDFDDTFGSEYFEPNITLEHAINLEGPGLNHLARSGVAAYLDSIMNPYADVEILKESVHDNNIHSLDVFISLCSENTGVEKNLNP